jgi:hypothetical protein
MTLMFAGGEELLIDQGVAAPGRREENRQKRDGGGSPLPRQVQEPVRYGPVRVICLPSIQDRIFSSAARSMASDSVAPRATDSFPRTWRGNRNRQSGVASAENR